jgi:hypothetical protein
MFTESEFGSVSELKYTINIDRIYYVRNIKYNPCCESSSTLFGDIYENTYTDFSGPYFLTAPFKSDLQNCGVIVAMRLCVISNPGPFFLHEIVMKNNHG